MLLARNTYRFSLLAIAIEIGADAALIPFALGSFALLLGAVVGVRAVPTARPGGSPVVGGRAETTMTTRSATPVSV